MTKYRVKTTTKHGDGYLVAWEVCGRPGQKGGTRILELEDLPQEEIDNYLRRFREGQTGIWPIVKMDELAGITSRAMFPTKRLSMYRHDIIEIEEEE